ncbi:MAG: virulence-associated E family protein [Lachnospiraceae bacterium]|nr:virulence-associated E family protein [Lachnospiraceae bacterium]
MWNNMNEETFQQIEAVRASLECTMKGGVRQSKQNCVTALENDPVLKGAIRYNLLTGRIDIVKDVGWRREEESLTDDDLSQLYLYLEVCYDLINEKNIQNAIRVVANRNTYHPIREYLSSLTWDGQERLGNVLHHFLGADNDELTRECMKLFMLGAIERVFHPGCKYEAMLCLVGDQGVGKSSFFRFLAIKDEWFSDDLKKMDDENVYRKMQGHWIIEMAEMLGTSSAKNVEEIKAFLSRQKETYKTPYDRYPKDRPRQCVFVGTSNRVRFLPLDRTGNRRFYPIQTDAAKAETHVLSNEAETRAYVDQLWAEVMVIYNSGDWSLRLSPALEKEMNIRRLEFMAEDTATGMVQAWLDSYSGDYVCTKMIYNECYKLVGDPDPKAKSEINSVMNNTIDGWSKGPQHRFPEYGQQRSWIRDSPTADVNGNVVNGKSSFAQMSLQDFSAPRDKNGFSPLPDGVQTPFED